MFGKRAVTLAVALTTVLGTAATANAARTSTSPPAITSTTTTAPTTTVPTAPASGKIIHTTNDSYFDGSTGGGGFIFLAGNVLKTDRRAAHLAIAVTAVRKSGGTVGPLAEKSADCSSATHCQVTPLETGHGQVSYKVPVHFTGEIDAVAKGTWYRRGKAPLVDTATEVYNFINGLLQP